MWNLGRLSGSAARRSQQQLCVPKPVPSEEPEPFHGSGRWGGPEQAPSASVPESAGGELQVTSADDRRPVRALAAGSGDPAFALAFTMGHGCFGDRAPDCGQFPAQWR
jgi:hypothetical protein